MKSNSQNISKLFVGSVLFFALNISAFAQPYYVAPSGDDANPGTLEEPFASLGCAQQAVRNNPGVVFLRGGTYYGRSC